MNIVWNDRWDDETELQELVGQDLVSVTGLEKDSEEVVFLTASGLAIMMYHYQDCCENVTLNDFECDVPDFSGAHVLSIEEVTSSDDETKKPSEYSEAWTWTFYKIETSKGGLWMRWLGESNGYYSESVDVLGGTVEGKK